MSEQTIGELEKILKGIDMDEGLRNRLIHDADYRATVSALESRLRGGYDYDEIREDAMVTTRRFYDADSVIVANTDVSLQIAGGVMWEKTRRGFPPVCGDDPIYLERYPMFLQAIRNNRTVVAQNIEAVFPADSIENKRLQQAGIHSFLAVPYKKRNTGLVAVVNPRRYENNCDLLQVLSYVIVAEINEKSLMEQLKCQAHMAETLSDQEVYVQLLDGLEIHSKNGVLTETTFKPRDLKFISYLLLKKARGFSSEDMCMAMWEADTQPDNARKALTNICNSVRATMRQFFPEDDLIVYENSLYGISSKYKVTTDYEEVLCLFQKAMAEQNTTEKLNLLLHAINDYPGTLLPSQADTPGIELIIAGYKRKRFDMQMKCIELLYQERRYEELLSMGEDMSILYHEESELIIYMLRAYIKLGELRTARQVLRSYSKQLGNAEVAALGQEIEAAMRKK